MTCTGGPGSASVVAHLDQETGNAAVGIADPVATRGFPLANNIALNSQVLETNRPMGNATFTYDVHVTTGPIYTQSGSSSTHWLLVDADGTQLDFGLSSSSPSPVGAVFCHLTALTGGGYSVTGAGPPGDINAAGNYAYLFNANGQLTQITDPNGNVQTLAYTNGELTSVTDQSTGKSISYSYTGSLITQVTEGSGVEVTQLAYSGSKLTSVTVKNSSGTTLKTIQISYDPSTGLLSSVQRDNDSTSTINFAYSYMPDTNSANTSGVPMATYSTPYNSSNTSWGGTPATGSADTVVETFQNNNAATGVQYNENSSGQLTSVVTPAAAGATQPLTETFGYTSSPFPTSYSDGYLTELYGYTTNGLQDSYTDGLNNLWSWTYNGVDLTASQDPVERAAGVSETWSYSDPNQPHVATVYTDAAGNTWSYSHNAHGQITGVTPPSGSPEGASSVTYDETANSPTLGYALSATDGAGDLTTYDSYDALGDLTGVSTYSAPNGTGFRFQTLFAYDGAQRLTGIQRPDGKTEQFTYTGRNLTSTTDEAGTQYSYSYCSTCGMMDGISGPNGWSLAWGYGPDHQLISFTDANSHETTYSYGNANELTQVLYPDNSGFSYLYNNQQLLRQITNGRGHVTSLTYDGDEHLSGVSFPTTGQAGISIGYDANSRVQTFTDGVGTKTYTYSVNGWLTKVVYNYSASGLSNAQELDYTYYPDGRRESLTWKNGGTTVGTWDYYYDQAGRLSSLTNPWSETTSWSYTGQSLVYSQTDSNNTNVSYIYNDLGWPTHITEKHVGTVFASYALTYDNGSNTVGNLTGVQEVDGSTVQYAYGALYRLTAEQRTGTAPDSHSFVYDLAGNRTSADGQSFTFDSANKITSSGYSYDGDGDLLTDGTSTYAWDDRSDLTSRTTGSTTLNYGYSASGLRVESSANGGTFYVFDGDTLLGEVSSNGTVQAAYTWGADGLVSERLVPSGTSLWYSFGPQGETRQLTNSAGAVVDSYVYTAYGQLISSSGTDANPFRFGGQLGYYTDSVLPNGVVLCTHRWYDPNGGRWLSRDHIGYDGGADLYAYCESNPTVGADPQGLDFLPIPPREPSSLWGRLRGIFSRQGVIHGVNNFQQVGSTIGDTISEIGDSIGEVPDAPNPPDPGEPNIEEPPAGTSEPVSDINEKTDMRDPSTWPEPPGKGPFTEGPPSRTKPASRGEKSLYDVNGGEWRPQKPDKYHPVGHWNHKAPGSKSPWKNIGCDGNEMK